MALITNLSMMVSTYLPIVAYLLDTLSVQPVAASSLRRLRAAYTGGAIRVRRSSDNAQQDIGFAGGLLDVTALLAFVGSGNGFVVTYYDQTGNGNHLTQSETDKQPRIVSMGTLVTLNSVPSISFTPNAYLQSPISFTTTAVTMNMVAAINSNCPNWGHLNVLGRPGVADHADDTTISMLQRRDSNAQAIAVYRNNILVTGNISLGSLFTVSQHFTSSQHTMYANGTSAGTANLSFSLNVTNERIGARSDNNGEFFDGYVSERLLFTSALSTANLSTIQTSQKAFYGTP